MSDTDEDRPASPEPEATPDDTPNVITLSDSSHRPILKGDRLICNGWESGGQTFDGVPCVAVDDERHLYGGMRVSAHDHLGVAHCYPVEHFSRPSNEAALNELLHLLRALDREQWSIRANEKTKRIHLSENAINRLRHITSQP